MRRSPASAPRARRNATPAESGSEPAARSCCAVPDVSTGSVTRSPSLSAPLVPARRSAASPRSPPARTFQPLDAPALASKRTAVVSSATPSSGAEKRSSAVFAERVPCASATKRAVSPRRKKRGVESRTKKSLVTSAFALPLPTSEFCVTPTPDAVNDVSESGQSKLATACPPASVTIAGDQYAVSRKSLRSLSSDGWAAPTLYTSAVCVGTNCDTERDCTVPIVRSTRTYSHTGAGSSSAFHEPDVKRYGPGYPYSVRHASDVVPARSAQIASSTTAMPTCARTGLPP